MGECEESVGGRRGKEVVEQEALSTPVFNELRDTLKVWGSVREVWVVGGGQRLLSRRHWPHWWSTQVRGTLRVWEGCGARGNRGCDGQAGGRHSVRV